MPFSCYWVALKINADYGSKMIFNTWDLLSADEKYLKGLRLSLLNLLWSDENKYYERTDVQSFLSRLDKTKLSKLEKIRIDEIKFKYELSISENQSDALDILVLRNKSNMSKQLTMDDANLWFESFRIFEQIYGINIEISRLIELAEIEEDKVMKYWLVYACCVIENGNYPNHSDKKQCGRIDKLIADVQRLNLNIMMDDNVNYLKEAAKAWKEWH